MYAVDVNARALELAAANAAELGAADRVRVAAPDEVPADLSFAADLVQPADPGRQGRAARDAAALAAPAGARTASAWLVVGRHLGGDSLQRWLTERGWQVERHASQQGFRVLRVTPEIQADADPAPLRRGCSPWATSTWPGVAHILPDGRELFSDVSFRVGEGAKVALVGPNGAGKTTLLRMVAGDLPVTDGAIARSGGLGVMRQFIGMIARRAARSNDLALSLAPPPVRAAGRAAGRGRAGHARGRGRGSTAPRREGPAGYADALAAWGEAGGYDAEVLFDTVSVVALGLPWETCEDRPVRTLSGGQQKRFALELLLRGPDEVLLLDEPDNFLDVPGQALAGGRLRESDKSVLYVSHDRELLAQTADRVVDGRGRHARGRIRAASPPGTRPGRPGTSGWTSCAGAGTRSTRSSRTWC